MPQFDPTYFVSQVFWLFICFFILVGFMKAFVIPRLKENLQRRSDHMNMLRSNEESYRQEIQELTQKVANLKNEEKQRAKKLLDQIHLKINKERESQLAELQIRLSKKQQEFNAQLEVDTHKIKENMSGLAKELSEKILTQLVEQGKERVKKHVHN